MQSLASDVLVDLLRSAWAVHGARATVYARWAEADPRYGEAAGRAREAARLIGTALQERGGAPDPAVAEAHASWQLELAGERPDSTPLGDWFLVRLADWVSAHAGPFTDHRDELERLCAADKELLVWPEALPEAPPFRRFADPEPELPGRPLFRFAVLGDLHTGSVTGDDLRELAVKDINSSGAELVIQLGDLTDHGDADEFAAATDLLSRLEPPVHVTAGNHDMYSYSEERLAGAELFEAHFGRPLRGELFEYRGFRFALLDSAEAAVSPFAPYNLVTGEFMEGNGGALVRGSLSDVQHDLLAELAEPGAPPAFVFLHHPPQPFTSFPPIVFGLRDVDSGRLHAVCDSGNVWAVFAGHTHRNRFSDPFGGVPVQEVAIPRDYPFGYGLVDVCSDGYVYRFMQLSDDDLLAKSARQAGVIQRRYAGGSARDRVHVHRPRRRS